MPSEEEFRRLAKQEYSYDAWGRLRDPATHAPYAQGSEPALFLGRGYTGHEHLTWFGVVNMNFAVEREQDEKNLFSIMPSVSKEGEANARLYDPVLGRFLSPDPYVQAPDNTKNYNRYSYCLNNPLIYTDPSGEWFLIDDAIAAVVGGIINIATNWKNIDNLWEGLSSFGAGAANGWLTLNLGPIGAVIGGGITGATNNIISQTGNGIGLKQVDWGKVGFNSLVGSASGIAGYGAGQWATNNLGSALLNGLDISSPVLSMAVNGAIGGAIGGYAGGFTAGYLFSGGDLQTAFQSGWSGMKTGGALGGGLGAASGYRYAKQNNLNPWTGKSNKTHSSNYHWDLSPDPNGDNVTLYRGLSGNEGKEPLFLSKEPEPAQAYADYYGTQMVEITISRTTFIKMQGADIISNIYDYNPTINSQGAGYVIYNKTIIKLLIRIL